MTRYVSTRDAHHTLIDALYSGTLDYSVFTLSDFRALPRRNRCDLHHSVLDRSKNRLLRPPSPVPILVWWRCYAALLVVLPARYVRTCYTRTLPPRCTQTLPVGRFCLVWRGLAIWSPSVSQQARNASRPTLTAAWVPPGYPFFTYVTLYGVASFFKLRYSF